MPRYRMYELDDKGHSSRPPWMMDCNDDDEAKDVARQRVNGHALELWCGERKVATIKPDEPTEADKLPAFPQNQTTA